MKKSIKYIIVSFTLVLIFIGSSLLAKAEFVEGNTSVRNAFEVPYFPFQLTFNVENSSDKRWFKVNLDHTMALMLKTDDDYGLDYKIYTEESFKDSNPEAIYESDIDSDFDYYKLQAGTYYIELYDGYMAMDHWKGQDIKITFNTFDDDKYELNDTYKQATPVQLGQPMEIRISGYNDVDYFRVKLDHTTALMLKTDADYGLDYKIYTEESFKDSNPEAIYESDIDSDFDYYKLQAGTYYIELYDAYMAMDHWKGQDIKITFNTFDDDKYELNDTYKQATIVRLGQPMEIRISGYNDIDWFKVNLNQTMALKLKTDADYGLDYKIYTEESFKDSNPEAIYESDIDSDFDYYKLQAGTYYIELYDAYMAMDHWKGQDIKITFNTFDDDKYEWNDSYKQATPVQLGQPMEIRISGYNDVDYFRVKLDHTTALKLKTDADYGLDYKIYTEESFKDSNPEAIYESDIDSDFDYYKLQAGTYYIELYDAYMAMDHWKGCDIRLIIESAIDDQFEYNDTWETAKSFSLSQEKEININAPTDVDWFKFTLSESKALRLSLSSNYSKTFNYAIYKENSPSNSIKSGTISSKSGNIGVSLEAGTYRLKLWGNDRNYSEDMMKFMIAVEGGDLVRPSISRVSPTGSNQEISKNIEITFSKPMDLSTLTKDNISLKWFNDSVDFEIDYLEGENKLILIPSQPLNYSSDYTIKILKNVKARGNQLTMISDYEWTFKTREKRPSDNEVASLTGKVVLNKSLQRLAMAGEVSLYQGSKHIKTVYPDRYGNFSFKDVASGQYTVKVTIPGFLSDSKTVTINYGDDLNVTLEPTLGDLNGDGIIDLYDITIVSGQYNQQSK